MTQSSAASRPLTEIRPRWDRRSQSIWDIPQVTYALETEAVENGLAVLKEGREGTMRIGIDFRA